jgi:hypothetical protein
MAKITKVKVPNVINFIGRGSNPLLFNFNKDIIRINDVNLLREDLERYTELKMKRVNLVDIQEQVDFEKYNMSLTKILVYFNIWNDRESVIRNQTSRKKLEV